MTSALRQTSKKNSSRAVFSTKKGPCFGLGIITEVTPSGMLGMGLDDTAEAISLVILLNFNFQLDLERTFGQNINMANLSNIPNNDQV